MGLGTDLARAGVASYSAAYSGSYPASNANDGNDATSAISATSGTSWIQIDLGAAYTVGGYGIRALNSAHNVVVQSSTDNVNWTTRTATLYGSISRYRNHDQMLRGGPVTARYWRLLNVNSSGVQIGTFSIYEHVGSPWVPIENEDVIRFANVAISAQYSSYGPERAIDDNNTTETICNSTPGWFRADLIAPAIIKMVYWREAQFGGTIQVQSSDDNSTWTTQTTVAASAGEAGVVLPEPIRARYWRLYNASNKINLQYARLLAASSWFSAGGAHSPMVMG